MEIEPERVSADLARRQPEGQLTTEQNRDPRRFDGPAASALELAVTEATTLGHNYIGCEHLLLGLAVEPDGVAGQVLRGLGAEPKLVRRAVTAALAGYVYLRAQSGQGGPVASAGQQALGTAVRKEIEPLTRRIARLEEHLGLTTEG
jgi:ATP-dependent Clp protease ATP-binding subunit ClpC